jgi:hypothetical protein
MKDIIGSKLHFQEENSCKLEAFPCPVFHHGKRDAYYKFVVFTGWHFLCYSFL